MAAERDASARAWDSERREFGLTALEEDLDLRIAAADEREAAADRREAAVDEREHAAGLADEATLRERAQARAGRAAQRRQRQDVAARRAAARAGQAADDPSHDSWPDYPLAAQFAEMATTLFAAGTAGGVLDHLVEVSTQIIDGTDAASLTMQHNGSYTTPAFTGQLAYDLDQIQYRHGEGPCVDAVGATGPAYAACADLRADSPWPAFAAAASAAGGRAVLSLGIFPDPGAELPRLGSLNLYSRQPDAFDDGSRDTGLLLAAHAGVALASVSARAEADLRTAQLERAMQSRDVIGQAKGILMARRGLTPEQAFDLLRDSSNRLNTKLIDLARRVTETGEAPRQRGRPR